MAVKSVYKNITGKNSTKTVYQTKTISLDECTNGNYIRSVLKQLLE
jgi:hypothetical protein